MDGKLRKREYSLNKLKEKIYLISPLKIRSNFIKDLKKVLLSNKIKFFQVRFKNISQKKIISFVKKIKHTIKNKNIKLIINDSYIIAKKVGADGCHLGQKDGSLKKARRELKKKIIGITCHNSKKFINKAIIEDADYIAIGSFFKSKLKPKAIRANFSTLRWARKKTRKPIVAIGGINNKNYKKILNNGANYIAISSFIWNNPSLKPWEAIKKFK